ncbi:HNH endonuclease [Clostridium sp. USBA 49]|uniref:HNH endonuclease signature motif containing protein n=1 Tax=Clostridium sp. USBA 49 TaxID=1881060 RepID=UPI0009998449|nr:HNH endonuclease signature motif containing protein [Clostridium sp. USBA 49]SKA89644.1 HNH endonuclease [Clostridium sp. USBA 49]
MAKEFAKKFYKSKEWEACRQSYIKFVFGLCERCGKPGYIVHHKIELNSSNINNPNITLNWDNLEYLCRDCHNKEHNFGRHKVSYTREGLMFNANGELVRCEDKD